MLRPATPLAGIFFIATAFLLLSSLTTPVINRLSLAEFDGSRFGVWGYCSSPQTGSRCSPIEVGYKIYELRPTRDQFSVSEDTRHNVSYILIIHPIAALLSFVCFCMATATHFHAPGHSPRFLMGLFVLTLPTFLIALLAFLVDILLFIPHLSVGGWFVLVAVVLLLLGSIVTCGMRRTLISRKARRKRFAENSEMNGEDFYARQAVKNAAISSPMSGTSETPFAEKTAVFGSYDSSNGTVLVDGPVAGQPTDFRPIDTSNSRTQAYERPPPIQIPRNDQNPYANSIPNDYYNQGAQSRQDQNTYSGSSQYRIRGGLTSPTHAYSQQRGGRMGAPPQYSYDTPSRAPRPNTYNNGNGGRGRGGYENAPSRNPMGPQGEINPYQATVSDFAPRSNRSPPRMNGYPPVRQQQPGLYTDRVNHAYSTDQDDPIHTNEGDGGQQAETSESFHHLEHGQPISTQLRARTPPEFWAQRRPVRSRSNPGLPTFMDAPDVPVIPDTFWTAPYPMDTTRPNPPEGLLTRSNNDNNTNNTNNDNNDSAPPVPPIPPFGMEPRRTNSLDSLPLTTGQGSPARSDYSHYTSVSQRGINPHWRPPPGSHGQINSNQRRRQSREQVLLDSNPDFSLPPQRSMYASSLGSRGAFRGGRGRGGGGSMGSNSRGGGAAGVAAAHFAGPPPPLLLQQPIPPLPRGLSGSYVYPLLDPMGPPGIVRDGRYPVPSAF